MQGGCMADDLEGAGGGGEANWGNDGGKGGVSHGVAGADSLTCETE